MKNILTLIVISISIPVFAACPINGNGGACVAEFQQTGIPALKSVSPVIEPAIPKTNFSETPAMVNSNREYQAKKDLRSFPNTEQDYGYNSSCQFGVCMDTGTPKSFPVPQN